MEKNPKILLISCSIHKKGNSYLALLEAERGIKSKGLETDWLYLNEYYLANGSIRKDFSEAISKVKEADGIIWGTPVYFGAWNSMAQEFLQELIKNNVCLFPKVMGFVVVGAKRNGGQETTITFASWDLIREGACGVNDGYPVSQFGGTCVGGLIGDVKKDKEGLEMSYNVGKRVAETVMIIREGRQSADIKIIEWPPKGKWSRCRGCAECPARTKNDYKCKFSDDDLHKVHKSIVEADGIMPMDYNLRFFERTRYLRRDNYRLTYHVVYITHPKWIPLFIKQNAILVGRHFNKYVSLIKTGRSKLSLEKQIYLPIGYVNPYLK